MSDCIFLVADGAMKETCEGFLSKEKYYLSLKTREFTFKIITHPECDPGVYNRSHQLLAVHRKECKHAVVMLDKDWKGSPEKEKIEEKIGKDLEANGWESESFEVIVIEPELEDWILQDHPKVEKEVHFDRTKHGCSLKDWLMREGLWPADQVKSPDPKLAIEKALRLSSKPRSSARYRKIASGVSITKCQDPALRQLREALQRWFPPE